MNFNNYLSLLLATLLLFHKVQFSTSEEFPEDPEDMTPEQKAEFDRLSQMEGHMKPLGSVGPYFDLFTIEGFPSTPREFFNKYVIASTPLLMKNAAKISPAFTKWTDSYFLNHPESEKEKVFAEGRKKEIRSEPGSTMSFKQFVEKYNTTDMYMVHGLPTHLKPDVIIPPPLQCDPVLANMMDVVTWFSSGGTKSVLHNDDVDNINCLYRGNKTLIFMNPHDDEEIWQRIIDVSVGSYSNMDVDAVDYTKYPDLAKVRYAKVDMQAGDCLYIPYRWYHQVNSFGSNLAVNLWWGHETIRFFDLTDDLCGDFTGRNTIANITYPGMDGDDEGGEGGAYDKPSSQKTDTDEFLKRYDTTKEADNKTDKTMEENVDQPESPDNKEEVIIHPPGTPNSYSDDYEADELHKKEPHEVDPVGPDETDPAEDPYIEPSEDSMTDKIYAAVLKVRKPVHMSGLKKYVLKKIEAPKSEWDERCQEILINYFGMLDQNKDTVITVEDADLYYDQEDYVRAQYLDATAFFQEDLHNALTLAAVRKERELVQELLDRGDLDREQIATIFGNKLVMPQPSEARKDEL